jgi:hypothetical protein
MGKVNMTYDQWLEIGLRAGWVSPPVCASHDGLPTSITEDAEYIDGSDPCMFVMRAYESPEHKEAVEANCFAAVWRNPFRGQDN